MICLACISAVSPHSSDYNYLNSDYIDKRTNGFMNTLYTYLPVLCIETLQ